MKNIKIKYSFLAVLTSSVMLFSCFEEDNFLDDNLTLTENYFPVVADFYLEEDSYAVGASAQAITVFWSEGPIRELQLYATVGGAAETLVSTTPYTANLVDSVRADVMVIPYTVPNVASGTSIDLRVLVVNENDFTKGDDDSFTVE